MAHLLQYANVHDVNNMVYEHRSHCHGSMHLNNDSKCQRSIPIAWCMILNPVDVRDGQSACDNKFHTCTLQAECT